jgi:hypothetical protein
MPDRETGTITKRSSKLISTSDKLMWICWEALRLFIKMGFAEVKIYAIRKSEVGAPDVIRANACQVLDKLSGKDVKQAYYFSKSSSEHLYFLKIPIQYIESDEFFTRSVSIPVDGVS